MNRTHRQLVLGLAARGGLVRPMDLDGLSVPRRVLAELVDAGELERVGRGLYMAAGHAPGEHHSLAMVCKRSPAAVVCLLSALRFHGLTTQSPTEVWIAVPSTARTPRLDQPARVFRFSGDSYEQGIETRPVEGVAVRVYSAAKTVADCFKFRNRVGVDVAVEALRDAWRSRAVSADDLARFATVCRVANVMRPYMETLS